MTSAAYRTVPVELPSAVYNEGDISTPAVAPTIDFGTGSPEGVITAPISSLYLNTAGPTLYVKVTGAGNTGWSVAIAVTPIALTSLATQATHTILANITGGAAVPTAATVAQIKTLLAYITTDIVGPQNYSGVGSPEGVVAAATGSLYTDLTTPATPALYSKTTGSGNTGWIAFP